MMKKNDSYLSYLLRLRHVTGREGSIWRASLEEPFSGQRYSFASLDALCNFLHKQTADSIEVMEAPLLEAEQMPY